MAATAIMAGLESLVASLPSKVNELLSSSRTAPSSSSASRSQIGEEVEKLCRMVRRIQALLDDAEEREITEKSIKLWLDELRDVAYDAEDVVEEFEYELPQYQLVPKEKENDQNYHQKRQKQMIAKIKDINNRFDEIYKHRRALKLSKSDGKRPKQQKFVQTLWTSSLLGDSLVYGRDDDKAKVLDMLLSSQLHQHGTKNVSVVSIVGMGGVGKTTLAQLVYNDDRVKNHFQVRSWVCVSDCFDALRLTKEILETLPKGTMGLQGFSPLQERLHENLKGKRFLLVLDDLWNENLGQWEALWKPLSGGAAGSKVLITTRNEEVSRISHAIITHNLKGLLKDDCWSLFAECAFGDKNPNDHPNLASFGKKIVKKCGGLPLAIRTLGGILFDESDEERWNEILESGIWELPEEKNDILPALRLSYHYLPSPIKPCFAFCAVFPKDYVFKLKELVSFWMAVGYIKPTTGRCMEDVGRKYVEELRRRSFFQEDIPGERSFKMHDLIHDLALSVWGSECSTIEDGRLFYAASRKVRHVSFNWEADVMRLLSCGSTNKFQFLRTFYLMKKYWPMKTRRVFSSKGLDDMFRKVKYLRVLCLLDMSISKLPHSVGNLKHLRYLGICGKDLSRLPETLGKLLNLQTLIVEEAHSLKELPETLGSLLNLQTLKVKGALALEELPETLGNLLYLQTLKVKEAHSLKKLPETLGNLLNLQTLQVKEAVVLKELPKSLKNLANLRHLHLFCLSWDLSTMPRGIGRLTQLRTLPEFVVGEGIHAAGIEELRQLNDLQGDLVIDIRSLNNWVNREPNILIHKKGLETLSLILNDLGDTCEDGSSLASMMLLQEELLESIQPHTNIRAVYISHYIGNMLPKWMEGPSYLGLKAIRLDGCKNCKSLPAFGQLPSLENLTVSSMHALTSVGREFLGDGASVFPSLEQLIFRDLPELEGLLSIGTEDGGAFPHLRGLVIDSSPKLMCVKLRHLTSLGDLRVDGCDELATLDFCHLNTSPSGSSSPGLQRAAVHHMHVPGVRTIWLLNCPKLSFPLAEQQRLPSSLRLFRTFGCPLLSEWVASHKDKLVGVTTY